jgi:homocysteine S-methyltransferase
VLSGGNDVPVLLDGGLSTALEQQGVDLGGALWTARLLGEAPEQLARAHRAYVEAGSRVVTTASYQASVEGLVTAGYDAAEARRLITRSVTVAQQVRDEVAGAHPGVLVAASVGPYGAFLADGSEYTGRYGVSPTRLRDFHGPRLDLLAAAGPDLFAVETIPDADEAEVLVPLLDQLDVPAWFSYSVRGETTNAGQPLPEAYAVVAGSRSVVAAGVNCSEQADVLGAVRAAVTATGLPGVAYPNRGGSWNVETKTWEYAGVLDLDLVEDWVEAGARLIGGCCGTGPSDIALLAARLGTIEA